MSSDRLHIAGVSFSILNGYEPLPDGTGVTNGIGAVVCTHLPEKCKTVSSGFNQESLAQRNLLYLNKTSVSVAGMRCDAIRFQQSAGALEYSKWAVFFPVGSETKLFLATFPASLDEFEQTKTINDVFSKVKIVDEPDDSHSVELGSFEYQVVEPFEVANLNARQVILTIGGVHPLKKKTDPLISLAEVPMRLLKVQFAPYIGKRIESLNSDPTRFRVADLSEVAFAVKGEIQLDGIRQAFYARYLFLPDCVLNAEAYFPIDEAQEYFEAARSLFDTIKPRRSKLDKVEK